MEQQKNKFSFKNFLQKYSFCIMACLGVLFGILMLYTPTNNTSGSGITNSATKGYLHNRWQVYLRDEGGIDDDKIKSVTFTDDLPSGTYVCSVGSTTHNLGYAGSFSQPRYTETSGVADVLVYAKANGSLYDIYLYCPGTIYAPATFNHQDNGYPALFNSLSKMTSINFGNFNTSTADSMAFWFASCDSLTSLDLRSFNTSNVKDMTAMFFSCGKLSSINVSSFNTSKVIYMNWMFDQIPKLTTLNINNFDTRNVTDMGGMFYGLTNLTSLYYGSNFKTDKVTDMSSMFADCPKMTSFNVANFNTSKVTDMSYMFEGCYNLASLDIRHFDTSKVTDMSYMFKDCFSLSSLDLSNFNTSNVTRMYGMFKNDTRAGRTPKLKSLDLSSFDTSKVEYFSEMFQNQTALETLNISSFRTPSLKNMSSMFANCNKLKSVDVSNFDTSNVFDASQMFQNCSSLTDLDLSSFDMSEIDYLSDFISGTNLYKLNLPYNLPEDKSFNLTASDYRVHETGELFGASVVDSTNDAESATDPKTLIKKYPVVTNGYFNGTTTKNTYYYAFSDTAQTIDLNVPGYTCSEYLFVAGNGSVEDGILTVPAKYTSPIELSYVLSPKQWTVTFDANEGSDVERMTFYTSPDAQTIGLPITTRAGYTFTDWTLVSGAEGMTLTKDSAGNWSLNIPANVFGHVSVQASWDGITNNVQVDNKNGSSLISLTYKTSSDAQTLTLTEPTRNGYTFTGWEILANDATATSTISENTLTIPAHAYGDLQIQATWEAITYTITYTDRAGQSHSLPTFNISESQQEYTLPTMADNSGYEFTGWSITTNTQGADSAISEGKFVIAANAYGNVVLSTNWTASEYDITFDSNGGSSVTAQNFRTSTTATEITLTTPEREGYDFSRWDFEKNTTNGTATISGNTLTIPANAYGDIALKAVWTGKSYNITYSDRKGSSYDFAIYQTSESEQTKTLSTLSEGGYDFTGWQLTETTSGISISGNTLTIAANAYGDIALTTTWTAKEYSVSLDPQNSTSVQLIKYSTNDTTTQELTLTQPQKDGYTFGGWQITKNPETGSASISDNRLSISANTYGDITINANWVGIANSVSYIDRTGNTIIINGGYTTSSSATTIALPTLSEGGYTFTGWEFTQNPTSTNATIVNNSIVIPANAYGDIIVESQWSSEDHTISFDSNGGTAVLSQGYNTSDSEQRFDLPDDPTRDGYTFDKWTVTKPSTGVSISGSKIIIDAGIYENITLQASWVGISNTISFTSDIGATVAEQQFTTSETRITTTLPVPTIGGYTFDKWTIEQNTNGSECSISGNTLSIAANAYGNLVIKSWWKSGEYLITINENNGNTSRIEKYTTSTSSQKIDLTEPTRSGYNFAGWQFTSEVTGITVIGNQITVAANVYGNASIEATWTGKEYTITCLSNGEISETIEYSTSEKNKTIVLSETTREGYTFAGFEILTNTKNISSTIKNDNLLDIFANAYGDVVVNALWESEKYSIKIDAKNGGSIQTKQYSTSETAQEISLFKATRSGYAFTGWKVEGTTTGVSINNLTLTIDANVYGEINIVGTWVGKEYSITCIDNGKIIQTKTYSTNVEDTSIDLNTPSQGGHDFLGWQFTTNTHGANSTISGSTLAIPTGSYGNIVLKTSWKTLEYEITIDKQNGDEIQTIKYSTTASAQSITLTKAVRPGFKFEGWEIEASPVNGSANINQNFLTLSANTYGNIKIKATWTAQTYTISIQSEVEHVQYTTSTAEQQLTIEKPERIGYTLQKFEVVTDLEGGDLSIDGNVITLSANAYGHVVLRAIWDGETWSIALDTKNESTPEAMSYSTQTLNRHISLEAPTKEGHEFVCWNITKNTNGLDSAITGNTLTIFANSYGDISLEAQWNMLIFNIIIDTNGAESVSDLQYVVSSSAQSINLPSITRFGYNFLGWTVTNVVEDLEISESSMTIAANTYGDIELQAEWGAKTCVVTLELNGGYYEASDKFIVAYNTVYGLADPVRGGYDFGGWYFDADFTQKVSDFEKVSTFDNHTIYAKWIKQTSFFETTEGIITIACVGGAIALIGIGSVVIAIVKKKKRNKMSL